MDSFFTNYSTIKKMTNRCIINMIGVEAYFLKFE